MGCGKSKHDVASDNTLQRKKSPQAERENGTETKDKKVENVVSSEVEQKNNEIVKEFGVGGKVDESNDVKDKSFEVKEDKTKEDVVDAPGAVGEEKKAENKKEEVETTDTVQGKTSTKEEETKDTNKEETLAKEKEETKDTNKEETLANKEEETKDTNEKESLVKEEKTKETIVPTYEGDKKN
ncbi:PREDICTED: nucleolar protein 58-like isoform X2 [Lupinus angustifolius]|uniref:nucleolar protein 58-like isoform X2 n=1 Tax=Lupinus angustifolius TaxID=3871 RepID=UPI00092EF0A2|nr:PREDICTED: nucleolar protein 58-like isoform X2 [Lupinus angustifolius]